MLSKIKYCIRKGWRKKYIASLPGKLVLMHYFFPYKYTDADPFKLIYVKPSDITYEQLPLVNGRVNKQIYYNEKKSIYDQVKNVGRVADGDWDLYKKPLDYNEEIYNLLYNRFVKKKQWNEIDVYKNFLQKISKGLKVWHRCSTIDELEQRAFSMDLLFKSIHENGCQPQYWVRGGKNRKRLLDEITVNIGRDGTLIYNSSGAHRLVIAKILELERIPVRILLRHAKWQIYRYKTIERITNNCVIADIEEGNLHPDLHDICLELYNHKSY